MDLTQFLNFIFSPIFGGQYFPPLDSTIQDIQICENWFQLLRPDIIIPLMFYLAIGYGFLYILFILPFRYFKRLIKAPDKKGKR